MSGRTGTRRARVLLALKSEHQTLARLAAITGLHFVAVADISKGLMKAGLAWPSLDVTPGVALTTAPHVEEALREARELVQEQRAQIQEVQL